MSSHVNSEQLRRELLAVVENPSRPLTTLEIAEELIKIGVNILDYNGGDADTLYAVNRCHELVDNCGERHASVDDDALSEAKRSKRHTRVARKGKATRQKKENGSRQLKWAYARIAQGAAVSAASHGTSTSTYAMAAKRKHPFTSSSGVSG